MGLLVPYPAPSPTSNYANFSGRPTTSWGTTLTSSGSVNTEGSITQVVASTSYDADTVIVTLHGLHIAATLTDALVNIYIGASNEKLLIPNLIAGFAATNTVAGPRRYVFPLRIARGTRIAASVRALIASDVVYLQLELLNVANGMGWAGAGVECLGAATASSRGTAVTPGTSSDGSWTSIGTSTYPYRAVLLALAGNTDTTATAGIMAGDIGTGSALIAGLENFSWVTSATEWVNPVDDDTFRMVYVPSGTALQARLQSHTTDSEVKYAAIYGVY